LQTDLHAAHALASKKSKETEEITTEAEIAEPVTGSADWLNLQQYKGTPSKVFIEV